MSTPPAAEMRIAELSRRSGVSIPTIKFYIREGLLPGGERTGPNQARYSQGHLDRLALIRALRDLAGLSVSAIARICAEIDRPGAAVLEQMAVVADALSGGDAAPAESPALEAALEDVRSYLEELGWKVRPEAPALLRLASALVTLRALYYPEMPAGAFAPYAKAALEIVTVELGERGALMLHEPALGLEGVVKGTILWEPVLLGLRRLAHEHVLGRR
ncbi:MAG: MerR family transcriptional regulator [Dehalococcoidia bacterium]